MSATLPNLREIAIWLDACLYVTHYRPVEVREYTKIGQDIVPTENLNDIKAPLSTIVGSRIVKPNIKVANDRMGIYPLIEETVRENGSLLVFCQSKNQCEQLCSAFMSHLVQLLAPEKV